MTYDNLRHKPATTSQHVSGHIQPSSVTLSPLGGPSTTIVAVATPHNNEPLEERDCANCNVAQENDELQQRVWELEAKLILPCVAQRSSLDAANERIAELAAALRKVTETVEMLHPYMNPDEPCFVYDAWLAAQQALKTGRKEAAPDATLE